MKLYSLLLLLFTLCFLGCQGQPEYQKVVDSDIDKNKLEIASSIANKLLMAQKNGGYYELSKEEAIDAMVTGLDEKLQKDTYSQIKSLFGDYEGLEFDHLMESVSKPSYEIYRFKGKFKNPEANVEIRAVLDSEGKLAGFFIKPWQEGL